jgi:hypothetical protein
VGLFWVPGHSGIRGNEIADELTREGSIRHFVGPEPTVGVSRHSVKKKIQCWLHKQHMTLWQGLTGAQRQGQELILGPHTAAKTMLLSFSRTQFRAVTGLSTRHNTMGRHLHIMGVTDSPPCRKCTAEDTSAHVLCECEDLATHRHAYLSSLFLDPEDIRGLSLGASWNFIKRTGLS